jgi:hypothetical protein
VQRVEIIENARMDHWIQITDSNVMIIRAESAMKIPETNLRRSNSGIHSVVIITLFLVRGISLHSMKIF